MLSIPILTWKQSAAPGHEIQQLQVIPHIGGRQAGVNQAQRDKFLHNLHGMAAISHKVTIDEINELAARKAPNLLDFMNYLFHRPAPEFTAVNLSDLTVIAGVRASPGGLGRDIQQLISFQIQQVITRDREVFQVSKARRLITRLKLPRLKVPEQSRPGLLSLALYQGISKFLALLRRQRGMETAHDHEDSPLAETGRQLVGPGGLGRHES